MVEHQQIPPAKPQRVLILGGSGFVARDLILQLVSEGIGHRAIGSSEIDLMKRESVAQLAAAIRPGDAVVITSAVTPEKGKNICTLMKNLAMVQHVAAAIGQAEPAHLIYISSDAVYSWRATLVRETTAREAADLYGLMHIAREQMLAFAAAKLKIPLCIFCPCAIYGAGDTHNSYGPNRFLRAAIQDRTITLFGGGEETRDHIYIEDVSRLLTLCLLYRSRGIINAVSGNAVSFYEVASLVAKFASSDVRIDCQSRSSPITHRHFDVTERIKAFPSFVPVSLKNGLVSAFARLTGLKQN